MADFPSLQPKGRSYDLGSHPISEVQIGSLTTRFLHGAAAVDVPISLDFPGLKESEAQLIRDHYNGQREHNPFAIPAALWLTHSSLVDVAPNQYTYLEPPQETPGPGGLVDVKVTLLSILPYL